METAAQGLPPRLHAGASGWRRATIGGSYGAERFGGAVTTKSAANFTVEFAANDSADLQGERAAVKWKLSTSALLASVAGTCALTPLRADAQQPPPAVAVAAAQDSPDAAGNPIAYDAVAILNGSGPQPQRDEAAQRLLSRRTAEARKSLHDALVGEDPGAELAAARALSRDPHPDPSFIVPLFPLLDKKNPDLAAAAGRALAGYKTDPQVLTRLIEYATARHNVADFTRLAAIGAIGTIPEKRAAEALRDMLTDPDMSSSIHKAAAAALTNLTGLEENGEDPARWEKWWTSVRNTPDVQFRTDVEALQSARLDRLDARYGGLVSAASDLLTDAYNRTKSQADREEMMLKFLTSPAPEIRKLGAGLLSTDVLHGNPVSDAELQRLRYMIADSDPGVRREVAKAIGNINDPKALDELLAQLKVEPDPTVRAAIAKALGPIQDLRAVPTLINLLSDQSLPTAEAAANALKYLASPGPLPSDPQKARQTALALRDTILAKSEVQGTGDLRAACIEALAPLAQPDIVQDLLNHKLMDPGKEESTDVRQKMLMAVGALNDPNYADPIVRALNDPRAEVQREAIEQLEKNPAAAENVDQVGALLGPDSSRDDSVREEAWQFLQGVFPKLNEPQLETWADRLKRDPERQLFALKALADKQQDARELEDLAVTRTEIGEAYKSLKQNDKAAASFGTALQIYNGLPLLPGEQATILQLVKAYEQALLDDGSFSDAVALAADRIARDPSEQSDLLPTILSKAEELSGDGNPKDLTGAKQLIDQATKIPKLDPNYQGRLSDAAADIQKKMAAAPK
jgi:HEAT repeat protein